MVYFVKSGDFMKIGYTKNVSKRIAQLSTGSPQKLELMGIVFGGVDTEKEYHTIFSSLHHKKEWFRYDGILKAFFSKSRIPDKEDISFNLRQLWIDIEARCTFDRWDKKWRDMVRPIQNKISEALDDDGIAINYYDSWQLLVECEKLFFDVNNKAGKGING